MAERFCTCRGNSPSSDVFIPILGTQPSLTSCRFMRFRTTLGRIYRDLMSPVHFALSAREFHRLRQRLPDDPEGWIQITERYRGIGWFADMSSWQVRTEFLQMFQHVRAKNPSVILEIGTAKGATLLGWCRS